MKLREIEWLAKVRRPPFRRAARNLARVTTVDDLRLAALRRWPRPVRDFVEGGSESEITVRRNIETFEKYAFLPRQLRDVSQVDTECDLLGVPAPYPFALAPTGATRIVHHRGELAVARAAARVGVPYTLATMATTALGDVAAIPGVDLWLQLYLWRDRSIADRLLDSAAAHGCRALVLTVDTPVSGLRRRDARNGFTLPPRLTFKAAVEMARHPGWTASLLRSAPIRFENLSSADAGIARSVMDTAAQAFDPSVTWADVSALRRRWSGKLLVKGLFGADDAKRAVDCGVDAVVLSNHGGRQLDRAVSPMDILAGVRAALGPDIAIFADSGIRSGADIAVALALGADGCLIGRPYLYGLGAAGEAGVDAVISILGAELRRCMALLGVAKIADVRACGEQLVRRM